MQTNDLRTAAPKGAASGQRAGPIDSEVQAILDALGVMSEDDRPLILAHLKAFAHMSPKRRAAILTLTKPDE